MSVRPMERWWDKPITGEADDAFDLCVCCDGKERAPGKPSCAECFCLKCLGYGVVCAACGEGPAMCVCSKVIPEDCSCRPHRHEQPSQ